MATLFIDSEGKRVNVDAPYTDANGVKHVNRRSPELLAELTEIQEPAPPADYVEEAYYKQQSDFAPYVSYVEKPAEALIAWKTTKIDAAYKERLYSNITALFPSGEKVIQIRDDGEMRTFERVTLAAITRQAAKRESATVDFRTEDNENQVVPASEFIPVALDVLDAKAALWKVRVAHKDSLLGLTQDEIIAYDENVGWPESNDSVWVIEERASKIYKSMIRRRADNLVSEGETVAAMALLKTIGE